MKVFYSMAAILLFLFPLSALDFDAYTGFSASTEQLNNPSPELNFGIGHESDQFLFDASLSILFDGVYPSPQPGLLGSMYYKIDTGFMEYRAGDISILGGLSQLEDVVDNRYALFFSPAWKTPLNVSIIYDNGMIYYKTQWIPLNENSAWFKTLRLDPNNDLTYAPIEQVPLDRGLNYKVYGWRLFDGFEIGYEESSIYVSRSFDADYFLNPLPGYFVQYISSSGAVPWKRKNEWGTSDNANFIMGLFAKYKAEDWGAHLQILIDDINMNRFIDPSSYQNPDKLAFNLSGYLNHWSGLWTGSFALATKYTFEPSGNSDNGRYGYTWYPGTNFNDGTSDIDIQLENTYIGYLNGENNLAFCINHVWDQAPLKTDSFLEFRIAGNSSPANPWHNYGYYTEGGEGLKFLDDPVLEYRLLSGTKASWDFGFITAHANAKFGWVWNERELTASTDEYLGNAMPIWVVGNTNHVILSFSAGVSIEYNM